MEFGQQLVDLIHLQLNGQQLVEETCLFSDYRAE